MQLPNIAISLSLVHGFGTVYHRPHAAPTSNWLNSNDCYDLTCLGLLKRWPTVLIVWRQRRV